MRRGMIFRPLGFILGLWSALLTGEPQWLHTCPTQSAPAAQETVTHASDDSPHAHHAGHVSAATGTPETTEAPAGHHNGPSSHECECVGTCACVALVSPPHGTLVRVPAPPAVAHVGSPFSETEAARAPAAAQRRLPWPTAPPERT